MSRKVFSSPLRHKEGDASAHGMRTDETAWHAKNDGAIDQEVLTSEIEIDSSDDQKPVEPQDVTSEITETEIKVNEIDVEKSNKIIGVNERLQAGEITEDEAKKEREYLDRVYDVTSLDDVSYNIEIEKVKAKNISDKEKAAEIDIINDNKIINNLGPIPDRHKTGEKEASSIVTEGDMLEMDIAHENAAEVLWNGLIEGWDEKIGIGVLKPPPTYGLEKQEIYTDAVPTSTERFAQEQETAKELKFSQNDLLDEILKERSINSYAIDNDLDYKTAAQHYKEKSWEDFGTQYQINYEDLSKVGKLTSEEINEIKNTFIERKSDKLTIAKLKKDISNHYDKNVNYFQHGYSEKQKEEISLLNNAISETTVEIGTANKRLAIVDQTRRNNIEEINKIDEDLKKISYGTVVRNGEILRNENGEEVTIPYSDKIQDIIDRQEKISPTTEVGIEMIEELNKEIDEYLKGYGQLVNSRKTWVRGLKNTDQLLKDELKNKDLLANDVEEYKAIQSVTDHYYGGLYRIAGQTSMSVLDFVAAVDEIGYSITGINISSEDGRKAIDNFREQSKKRLGGEASKGLDNVNSAGGLAQYTAELVFGNSVIFATSILSGGWVAPVLVGGTTASGLDYERTRLEMESGKYFYEPWQRHLSAGLHFGVEGLSEIILAKQVLRVGNDLAIDNTFKTGWSSYFGEMLNLGTRTGTDAFQSGLSEGLAGMGGNATDRYVLKKDVHIMDGVGHQIVDGALMSLGPKSVSVFHATTKHLIPDTKKITLTENSKRLYDINNLLKNSENLSEEVRLSLEKQQNDIVNENNEIVDAQLKGSITYTNQEKQDLIDADVDMYNLQTDAKNISKDNGLTNDQKRSEIELLKNKFNELNTKKQEILNKDTRTDEEKIEDYNAYVAEVKRQVDEAIERDPTRKIEVNEVTSENVSELMLEQEAEIQAEIDENQRFVDDPNASKEDKQVAKENIEFYKESLNEIQNANRDFGFISQDVKTGKQNIYINKETSLAKEGRITTAAHEFLHAVLFKTIGKDATTQEALGGALTNFINKKGGVSQEFLNRMKPYVGRKNMGEEMITIMSESIMDGSLKFDEGLFTKIGDSFRRFFQKKGWTEIRFDNGRQVYNFIKDYNHSIKNRYTSKAIAEAMDKGIKGKLTTITEGKVDIETKQQFSKVYQEVEAMKPGLTSADPKAKADAALIAAYTLENEVDRRLPQIEGLTKEDKADIVRNFLFSEGRGLVGTLLGKLNKETGKYEGGYDPKRNDSIMGYLNSFVPGTKISLLDARLQEFYKDDPRFGNIVQSMEQEGVAGKVEKTTEALSPEEVMIAKEKAKAKEKVKKKANLEKKLKLTEKDIGKFINTLEKAFGTKLPPVTSKEYRLALEKIITTDLKNTIQTMFGKGADYDIFIENDMPLLLEDIRVEALIQMEREVGGKKFPKGRKIFATKRRVTKVKEVRELQKQGLIAKDVKPESGPNLLTRLSKPNKEELDAFFRGVNMKEVLGYKLSESAFGTRKDRFAENLAIELGFNKAMEIVQNPEILAKRLAIEEIQGREQIENYVVEVGRTIDRNPTIQYSKSIETAKKEYNLGNQDLSVLLKEETLGQIEANYPILYDALIVDFEKKYGPQDFKNKRYLDQISEESSELAKIVKDKKHITRSKSKGKDIFNVERLKNQFNNYSLEILDFIPSFMGVRENKVKGNYKFLTNGLFKGSSSRGNAGETLNIRKKRGEKFQNKYTNDMGKRLTPETKKLWNEFNKIKDNLELAESTFDMPETLLRDLRRIQRSNKTAKQKIKEAQKLFNPGALNAAQKLFTAYNASIQDWVNYQVDNNNMTREEAMEYVIRDKQKNTNFTKGERALAAFTSVYFTNGIQKLEKKDSKGEHVKDSATVSAKTTTSIYNNTFIQDASSILNGFEQSYIPKKFANEMDRLGGENSPLKNFRFILNPQIGKSVYDLATGKTMYDISLEKYKLEQVKILGKAYIESESNVQFSKAINNSRLTNKDTEAKGITVLDFDDTLATTKSKVLWTAPDGTTGSLNAEQYASTYQDLAAQGYKFDFSEFNKVIGGKTAPLFNKALKLQDKFGPKDMFILTARPPEAQQAIYEFLQAQGLNIPLKNITGLGNSTSEAKALWMADKVADGYNDFYFADDALQNVQAVKNMLDQFDIKSKVQQAKIQFSKNLDTTFNEILEDTVGVKAEAKYSDAQAKLRGKGFKFRGLVPPSAQDFAGLLYNFIGKGKKGEQQFETLKKALIDPFGRGINELNTARQKSSEDYRNLLKEFPEIKKMLNKKVADSGFTVDQAIRVYLWNKAGFEIPGLSARDLNTLDSFVKEDSETQAFADGLGLVSKKTEGYTKPGEYWLVENIASDLMSDGAIGDARAEFLAEWQQNADQIFSNENLNKIEAIYGSKFREALEDVLYRMETGRNRPTGSNRLQNAYMNWVNNSVGAIMFFNIRSAVLQTISATNYINWSDNNPLKAGLAFANQKQFWSDFSMIFNSDYLKQRRSGNRRGINEAELSAAVANSDNKVKAALSWLLTKGFLPTQIADSFAIASGGAAFYRNRVKSYVKQGMSKTEAETQAFLDFQETTEVSQQSARPDLISQQQANPLGRLILSFQNTPMQYGRIMNKAFRDIANGRGDTKTHVSKIVYYGAIQGIIFTALQSALFAVIGSDDDDEKKEMIDKKTERMANSMIDTWLTTFGYGGKAIGTVKNTVMEFNKQRDKDLDESFMTKSDHAYTLLQALGFSPPIGSKLRKIYQSIQTEKFNRDLMKQRGLTLDNPIWSAVGNVIEGVTNAPLGRLSNKLLNLDNATDSNNETWQRIALILGWNTWDLGIKDPDLVSLGSDIKERKKQENKMESEKKKFEKKRTKLKEKYPDKTEKEIEVIVKSKELFSLSKQTQIDILKSLDVSDKDIKKLKKEKDRTDYIANKYKDNSELIDKTIKESKSKPKPKKKEKVKLSKSEQYKKSLFKMKKQDQINRLMELGYPTRKIYSLTYEKDRVEMIIKLESRKSK